MSPRNVEKMDKTRGFSHRISLRISDREFQILQDASKSLGLNLSETLRFIISTYPNSLMKGQTSEHGDEKNGQ